MEEKISGFITGTAGLTTLERKAAGHVRIIAGQMRCDIIIANTINNATDNW